MTTAAARPYTEIQELVTHHGGKMTWRPMGQGGDWILQLHGKTAVIQCRDRKVNALDSFYVSKTTAPDTWEDFDHPAPMRDGSFWRLINLFSQSGV